MSTAAGIDISAWQDEAGPIDFAKVRASGRRFVWIKATQGLDYINPHFAEDAIEAAHAGLLVGAYHFAEPNQGDAVEQAEYFRRAMIHLPIWLGHALDLETLGTLQPYEIPVWAEAWLKNLATLPEPHYLYTLPSWIGPGEVALPTNAYGAGWWLPDIDIPAGVRPTFLQSLEAGTVDGIEGDVDLDTCLTLRGINPPRPPVPATAAPAGDGAPNTGAPAEPASVPTPGPGPTPTASPGTPS